MNSILKLILQNQNLKIIFLISFILFGTLLILILYKRKSHRPNVIPDPIGNPVTNSNSVAWIPGSSPRMTTWIRTIIFKSLPFVAAFFALATVAFALLIVIITPKVTYPSDPALGTSILTPDNPITVKIDRPIDKNKLKYSISPTLPGSWHIDSSLYSKESVLTFTPEESPEMNTRYTISIENIKNILGMKSVNYLFSFQSPEPPKITSSSVKDGDQGILPNQTITFDLDYDPENIADIRIVTSPETLLDISKDKNIYTVKPQGSYAKGTEYQLSVYQTPLSLNYRTNQKKEGVETEIGQIKFKTIDAPGIKSSSPTGSNVLTNQPISIEFLQDMEKTSTEAAFSISPKTTGNFSWESPRKITFTSTNLVKNTLYTITLSKSALAGDGSPLEDDLSFTFTTIGYVSVGKFTPGNKASNIALDQRVIVAFNQAVDHASAQSKFSVTPNINGTFSWDGNSLIFTHDQFTYNQNYTIKIDTGIKSINGLDSKDIFTISFTTRQQNVTLDVPAYHQAHMYSCEISALRSALAFWGINKSESEIISAVGTDTTAWSGTWSESGAVWGDPETGIVGDLDGKANSIGWGYGTHWQPIAKAVNSFGRTAETKTSWSVSELAQEIANGNPVIIWWVNGVWPSYEINWKTPGGKSIRAVNGMHVQVVKGFSGTIENPTSFTITDSGYGYPGKTIDTATFKAKWSWFNNTAVIVK